MTYQIVWEPPRGAYKKFTGHVTDDELLRSVYAVYGDARFDDLRYVVNDFLDVESFAVTEDTVTYIAAIDGAAARSNSNIKVAIVVIEEAAKTLALRYAASPWTLFPTRLFASVEEARAWTETTDQPDSRP